MTLPAVHSVSSDQFNWYISSAIGAITGFAWCWILLIHILYHYCKIIQNDKNPYKNLKQATKRQIYYFMIAYLIFSILLCLFILFGRSNFITEIKLNEFTELQCTIGYFGVYISFVISTALMLNLFNYRIQTIFKNTQYAFNNKLYIFMYIIPWYNVIVGSILLFFGQVIEDKNAFSLYTDNSSYIIYCGLPYSTHFQGTPALTIFLIHSGVIECIMSVILLSMFTSGLYKLHTTLKKQHKDECVSLRAAQSDIESTYDNNNDIEIKMRLMALQNIMKKQTILVFIAILSSLIYYFVSSLIYSLMSFQSCWVIMINASCTWLMFGSASSVWNFIAKYVCCNICYKDINLVKNDGNVQKQ